MKNFVDKHFKKVNISLFLLFIIVNAYTIIEELYLTKFFNVLQIALTLILIAEIRKKDIEYEDKKFMTEIFVFANVIQFLIIFILKTLN